MKLILDFDGVLFDTAYEAYKVSLATYESTYNVKLAVAYDEFLEYRHVVGPAWNYKYVLDYLLNGAGGDVTLRIENAVHEEYRLFEKNFFQTREGIKNSCFDEWMKLNKPFDFINVLGELELDWSKVYIVSTKDKKTILDILTQYSFFKIEAKNVYGSDDFDSYGSKGKLIDNEIPIGNETVIFIDDMVKHLDSYTGVKESVKLLPAWGYVSPCEKNRTKTLDEISVILKQYLLNETVQHEI